MDSQYYRTFIGLPLQVEPRLLEARKELVDALSMERISWTNPDQYHLTLRFIGETSISSIEEIGKALHSHAEGHQQETLEIRELSSFGPRKAPRVIWLGFHEARFVEKLKQEVDQALETCGLHLPDQTFKAHLTLGRVRHLQDLQRYYQTLDRMGGKFAGTVLFEKLVFYQSTLGAHGPVYRALDEIRFRKNLKP